MMNNHHPQRRAGDQSLRRILLASFLLMVVSVAFQVGRVTATVVIAAARDEKPIPRALPDDVVKFHDASEEVTCWKLNNGYGRDVGISCLPDQWLASSRVSE
jgi:hypothetical protein